MELRRKELLVEKEEKDELEQMLIAKKKKETEAKRLKDLDESTREQEKNLRELKETSALVTAMNNSEVGSERHACMLKLMTNFAGIFFTYLKKYSKVFRRIFKFILQWLTFLNYNACLATFWRKVYIPFYDHFF